ncbi:MAG: type II toxin-antitoxin system VapC family toxin [Candidatus Altiarchaeota archaeon]
MVECIDASVVVKWFKKDEPYRKEAEKLYRRIRDLETEFVASEWILLEVTRGLVKANVKREDSEEACDILNDLFSVGAVKRIPVSGVMDSANGIELDLNLYAADAVHLATAIITNSRILWSEDEHLHKKNVTEYARKHGLNIQKLSKIRSNE